MIPGWWTELAATERIGELCREAEHQRLIRSLRRGNKVRRVGSMRWHGWVGLIGAPRARSRHRAPWRRLEFLTQRGDRS